jgi:hypothetical protein
LVIDGDEGALIYQIANIDAARVVLVRPPAAPAPTALDRYFTEILSLPQAALAEGVSRRQVIDMVMATRPAPLPEYVNAA